MPVTYPSNKCLHEILESVSLRDPSKTALIQGPRRVSYSELNHRAADLACQLIASGMKTGDRVAVYSDRSIEALIAFVGILKAGGAYVPIDTAYPVGRTDFLLKESQPFVILTSRAMRERLQHMSIPLLVLEDLLPADVAPKQLATDHGLVPKPTAPVDSSDLAYILFTSGTTGTPKGVAVPHRAIERLVFDQEYAHFGPEQTFLQLASLSFDAATLEIWGPLLHGGTCVLYPGGSLPDPTELKHCLKDNAVTTAWLTSTLFNTIVTVMPEVLASLKELLIGGEALSIPHVCKALSLFPKLQIINGYGPTENTTFTCCYRIPHDLSASLQSVPIGFPIAHTQVHILSDEMKPVPAGEIGEIFCGGDGLADGYWQHDELTREKFIIPEPPLPAERLYRTGDYGRLLPNGAIEFMGRRDDQVKIRGFRVELGEISATIQQYDTVTDAAVVAHQQKGGSVTLVAYVVTSDSLLTSSALQDFLGYHLSDYMIPSEVIFLTSLPLTVNGKLDRSRLPQPGSGPELADYIAPQTAAEKQLAAIWARLLAVDPVGIDMNFFDLGGTSLLSIELISAIGDTFATEVPLSVVHVYQYPTIKDFARYLTDAGKTTEKSAGMSAKERAARRRNLVRRKPRR